MLVLLFFIGLSQTVARMNRLFVPEEKESTEWTEPKSVPDDDTSLVILAEKRTPLFQKHQLRDNFPVHELQ